MRYSILTRAGVGAVKASWAGLSCLSCGEKWLLETINFQEGEDALWKEEERQEQTEKLTMYVWTEGAVVGACKGGCGYG